MRRSDVEWCNVNPLLLSLSIAHVLLAVRIVYLSYLNSQVNNYIVRTYIYICNCSNKKFVITEIYNRKSGTVRNSGHMQIIKFSIFK